MLSNQIKNLLNTHSRVIVPDLGAFILKGDSSQSIYFNEFLRFNDGILIDYIAQQEKIDKTESAEKVKKFVDQINQQLSTSKSAEIAGLGVLFIDSNDKIQLKQPGSAVSDQAPSQVEKDPGPREIFFEIEKTEPITSAKPGSKPTKKTKAQTKTKPIEEVSAKAAEETPIKLIEETPEKQVPEVVSIKEEKSEAQVKIEQPVQQVQPTQSIKSSQTSHTGQATRKSPPQKQVSKTGKSRAGLVWLIIGILAVLGAIVYFAFFTHFFKDTHVNQNIIIGGKNLNDTVASSKDIVSRISTPSPVKTNTHNVAKTESSSKDQPKADISKKHALETKHQTSESVSKNEIAKPAASTGKKYYLVAGCFSVKENADRLVNKLNGEGFQAEKFVTTKNNLYYVSYSSYTSKTEASQEMARLKSAGKSNVWILNY